MTLSFSSNDYPTVGVEVELQLVDATSMALRSAIDDILERLPPELEGKIKPELMQCYLEINSDVCRTVADVEGDLSRKIKLVEQSARDANVLLLWAATHPFSHWHEQKITPDDRYLGLVDLLQDTARRLVTFGLHVHVGVDSGDKAVMICDRIMRHLPTLLALSSNSPFWHGRLTGLRSQRSKVMENLPTAGLPPLMRNWSEYVWLINHLIQTGFINSNREIWWDVRPHHVFGTVEVRICDMPPSLEDVLGLTALTQCLVHSLSEAINAGTFQHDGHPMIVRQNKWRAGRFGMDAQLVDPQTAECLPAREVVRRLVEILMPAAEHLDCVGYLEHVLVMAERPTGADRQIEIYKRTNDSLQVVRELTGNNPHANATS
ncbi:Carboxylate-amine ligase YbdK [Planctomycetes bacterium Pan216]|uniref:Putative glutamate--cysteine ligase 2 n=1 Tax=Kolteria novifilia TaxID=2527975 RepID=A0A518BBZ9_9BACT|nr:Carboxylate-amine ligase YbdK [Planctomycetes bacterium Pan216]